MTTQPLYEYADGSANLYSLEGNTLSYDPVKPEESSTGMYSGGEPKTVQLTQHQADSIRLLMEEAFTHNTAHIQDRLKGSGAIYISADKTKKQFILEPGCEDLKKIEAVLRKCIE